MKIKVSYKILDENSIGLGIQHEYYEIPDTIIVDPDEASILPERLERDISEQMYFEEDCVMVTNIEILHEHKFRKLKI